MKLYCDGSTTKVCYKFETCEPIIINLNRKVTNNEGEYQAIIYALGAALRLRWKELLVLSDSQLIVNQLNRAYKIKKPHLKKLAENVLKLGRQFDKIEFKWIRRTENLAGIALEEN